MNSDPVYPSDSLSADLVTEPSRAQLFPGKLGRQPPWVRYGLLGTAGLLILVGGAAGMRIVQRTPSETSAEASILPVETLPVEAVSSYQVPRIYTGEIAALRSSELGFERGGELVQVMVNEGQRVRSGEPVARLDTRNLETQKLQVAAQKAQAQARLTELENGARPEDIAAAKAQVRDLEQQLILQETQEQRREYLYERGAIAQEQLDEFAYGANSLQAKLDQARSQLQELLNGTRSEQLAAQRAAVEQLQAQLQDIDVNLTKSTITAPFDGIVGKRTVDEGTVIGTGQSVIELVEAAAPEARIGIPAAVVNQLQIGSTQTVRVNNQPYQAEVAAVLPKVEATTRTQTVVLTLDPTAIGELEPGQTARLAIDETIQTDGFWLPTGALTEGIRGLWTCYVLVPAGGTNSSRDEAFLTETPDQATRSAGRSNSGSFVIEQRSVEIIQQESVGEEAAADTRALVRGTLQPGEQVVASGVHRLVPGQQVRPIAAE